MQLIQPIRNLSSPSQPGPRLQVGRKIADALRANPHNIDKTSNHHPTRVDLYVNDVRVASGSLTDTLLTGLTPVLRTLNLQGEEAKDESVEYTFVIQDLAYVCHCRRVPRTSVVLRESNEGPAETREDDLSEIFDREIVDVEQSISGEAHSRDQESERRRILQSILIRRGQPKFRQALMTLYAGRCVISGCDSEYALEAAHIRPYSERGSNDVGNGLLLRADLHLLFDRGLISINGRASCVVVHARLSGTEYDSFSGKKVVLAHVDMAALDWHRESCGL